MSLIKIITIIVAVWLILKAKRIISGIISTSESVGHQKIKSRKTGMDIQDADYEDVE